MPNFSSNELDLIPVSGRYLELGGVQVTDLGNGDGRPDPGETCEIVITINNHPTSLTVANFSVQLTTNDPALTLGVQTVNFGSLAPGASVSNTTQPFTFTVQPCEPHYAALEFILTTGNYSFSFPFQLEIGRPPFLLVDDDGGTGHETYYLASFDSLDLFVDVWTEQASVIPEAELARYQIVIWETGNALITLSGAEQTALQSYLDQGGKWLFSSTNAGADFGGTSFYSDYLHAQFMADALPGVFGAHGADGCPFISSNDSLFFIGSGGAGNIQSLDVIQPLAGAQPAYLYNEATSSVAGIYFEAGYKLIYLAFPLEAVSGFVGTVPREVVLNNVIDWFGVTGVLPQHKSNSPAEYQLNLCFPNPFNLETRINFYLPTAGGISLEAFDLQGRKVASLFAGWQQAGFGEATFTAANLANGIYFLRLTAADFQQTRKLVLLK